VYYFRALAYSESLRELNDFFNGVHFNYNMQVLKKFEKIADRLVFLDYANSEVDEDLFIFNFFFDQRFNEVMDSYANIHKNFDYVLSFRDFFENIDKFVSLLSVDQQYYLDSNQELLSSGLWKTDFILLEGMIKDFFSDFFSINSNISIENTAVFFSASSLSTNYLARIDNILQSVFMHLEYFSGLSLDQMDSYMLGDSDLSSFQHRVVDTDSHFVSPSNYATRFFVNALDVLHSFTILSTGVKVDAIVGRVNDMTMFLLREGLFFGQCSELCGAGHYSMPIVLEAMNPFFFFCYHENKD